MKLTAYGSDDRITTLSCAGDIGCVDFVETVDPLARTLGDGCYERTVLVDMQKTKTMDTLGAHWLVRAHERFESAGGKLILHSLPPRVRNMLNFLQFDRMLSVAPNLTNALAQSRGRTS